MLRELQIIDERGCFVEKDSSGLSTGFQCETNAG